MLQYFQVCLKFYAMGCDYFLEEKLEVTDDTYFHVFTQESKNAIINSDFNRIMPIS